MEWTDVLAQLAGVGPAHVATLTEQVPVALGLSSRIWVERSIVYVGVAVSRWLRGESGV